MELPLPSFSRFLAARGVVTPRRGGGGVGGCGGGGGISDGGGCGSSSSDGPPSGGTAAAAAAAAAAVAAAAADASSVPTPLPSAGGRDGAVRSQWSPPLSPPLSSSSPSSPTVLLARLAVRPPHGGAVGGGDGRLGGSADGVGSWAASALTASPPMAGEAGPLGDTPRPLGGGRGGGDGPPPPLLAIRSLGAPMDTVAPDGRHAPTLPAFSPSAAAVDGVASVCVGRRGGPARGAPLRDGAAGAPRGGGRRSRGAAAPLDGQMPPTLKRAAEAVAAAAPRMPPLTPSIWGGGTEADAGPPAGGGTAGMEGVWPSGAAAWPGATHCRRGGNDGGWPRGGSSGGGDPFGLDGSGGGGAGSSLPPAGGVPADTAARSVVTCSPAAAPWTAAATAWPSITARSPLAASSPPAATGWTPPPPCEASMAPVARRRWRLRPIPPGGGTRPAVCSVAGR